MSGTDGFWTQDTPYSDMEIFVGASEFKDIANLATYASAGAGLFTLNLAATQAGNFMATITAAIKRTGVYATPSLVQEQFGTAAALPGPTLVPNTSDPEGIRSYPPYSVGAPAAFPSYGYPSAQLATLVGPAKGPVPKGIQVNSIDVIYALSGANASLAQVGLAATNFVDNTASANIVNLIALGANGLATTQRANLYRTNVPVATPGFLVLSDTQLTLNVKITTIAAGAANFYGCVAKCSYNFN